VAEGSVLGEIAGVVPRLVRRTAQQVDVVRVLASHLPCVGRLAQPPAPAAPLPAHDDPPIDILRVIATGDDSDLDLDADRRGASDGPGAPAGGASPADLETGSEDDTVGPAPDQDELAVPDYDSLAASQVVPRLAALSADELDAVGRYEAAHRKRRTILHRVEQLRRG
jgi:hypothetical protein